jgi:hypothetical protein
MPKPLKITAIGILLFILTTSGYKLYQPLPDNAIVVVNDATREYHSPRHGFFNGSLESNGLRLSTLRGVRDDKYRPDYKCEVDFEAQPVSLLQILTGRQPKSRINADGSWNDGE